MQPPGFRVEIEPDGPGRLVVRWALDWDGELDIAVGASCEPAAHTHLMAVPVLDGMARLEVAPGARHYVSLSHRLGTLVVAERRVPFCGLINFRDIGGYPTDSGGTTRWGLVFRSDSLHLCTAEDLTAFDALGVETIYDLRRDSERDDAPGPRPCVHMTLPGGRIADADPMTLGDRASGERWLLEDYTGMLANAASVLGELFARLARPGTGPAVIHCWAGKDRTGLTVAVLLSWLGVARATVLDDYALTGAYTPADRLEEAVELFVADGVPRGAAVGMLGSPRWVMAEAMGVMDDRYGGVEAYLRGPAGLDDAVLSALRERLVGR